MQGQIESIAYSDRTGSSSCYCYVAINDSSSGRTLYYHEVKREQMCRFAERCKELKIPVKIVADAVALGANKIETIEHGGTDARWWKI